MFLHKKRFPLQFYLKKESPVIFTYSASSAVSVVSAFSSAVSSALSASLLLVYCLAGMMYITRWRIVTKSYVTEPG